MENNTGVMWWTAVCGNRSRNDAFWDDGQTVNTNNPDFTQCFQSTALVWGPCALLWLCAPFFVSHLSGRSTVHSCKHFSCLNAAKVVTALLLLASTVVQLVHVAVDLQNVVLAEYLAPVLYIVTYLLALWLMHYEFCKGEHSSGVMFCFWLFLLICNIIPFRTNILVANEKGVIDDVFSFSLFYISFFFIILEFIFHLFADQGALVKQNGPRGQWKDQERQPLLADHTAISTAAAQEEGTSIKETCPELKASFLSRLTFFWSSRILLEGYKKNLTANKLWDLRPHDKAKFIISHFYESWIKSNKNKETLDQSQLGVVRSDSRVPNTEIVSYDGKTSPQDLQRFPNSWQTKSSLVSALWKSFGYFYSVIAVYEVLNITLTFIRPLLLDALIGFVEDREGYMWRGYLYAFLLFVVTLLRAVVQQLHFYGKMITGQRIRSSIVASVYRKSLLLANSSRKEYSVGSIVNLMSVDAQRLGDSTLFIHNMWSAPVNVIVAMVLLWRYLGASSLAGLGLLLILMAMNLFLVSRIKGFQVMQMKFKDTRTKLTNEILNGIKVLKLYAWEGAFQKKLLLVRDKELNVILKAAIYISGTAIVFTCAPVLFTVLSFSVYILVSRTGLLSPQVAFVSLSLVNSLSRPLIFIPNGINNFVQAYVSVRRLEKFLNGEELDPDAVTRQPRGDNAVEVKQGTFSWEGNETIPVLQNINFAVKRGSLTCIVGQVGSGKSSLLSALLGELHKSKGFVNISGCIAYVSQEAWVRNLTLKNNVLFGKALNENKYHSTIEDCALTADLEVLPAGDQTEIGEKGINLSGGQKQRVALARAVYQDCDVYLMDDPLSAVDAHVGKHIYDHVIGKGGCLQHKTRVLVTHGVTQLPKADQIIVLKDGQISEIGTYQDLLTHNGAFADLMNTYLNEGSSEGEENSDPEEKALKDQLKRQMSVLSATSDKASGTCSEGDGDTPATTRLPTKRRRRKTSTEEKTITTTIAKKGDPPKDKDMGQQPTESKKGQKLIDTEKSEIGGVKWRMVFSYLRSMGLKAGLTIILFNLLNIGSDLGSNIWLSQWSGDSAQEAANQTYMDPNLRVGIYGVLGCLQALSVLGQTIGMALGVVTAARILHENLLDAIIHAPMAFFDTTPTGRILNRFSQDMATADSNIRFTMMSSLRGFTGMIATIVGITYTTPIFLAMVLPMAVLYYFLQRFYIMSSNQLQRLANVRTSPLYSHFGETITGASCIRAFGKQKAFEEESDRLLDSMQEARYPSTIVNRWLSIWMEVFGGFIVLFCALFAVLSRDTITAGLVGLAVSYSLQLTDKLGFLLRNTSDLEKNVVSIERIKEYSETESEAPWHYEHHRPPGDWPSEGQVSFDQYATRYRPDLDLVLKDVTCNIGGGEKIGIVGRTGAGKSSMTLALFRIIEAASGSISIDSLNCSMTGLHDLRSKLTIIPQDPVLFTGSLRFNVDPFNEHSEREIWDSFRHAHLKTFVESLADKLNHECTEGGQNLSVGQRQLVCLARALLRRTKVLVLDEATAAVDLETDDLIQSTIRTEFKDATVITIAHRINTVMDYERIMVLDGGKIVEFESPNILLGNKDSLFFSLCKDAGLV